MAHLIEERRSTGETPRYKVWCVNGYGSFDYAVESPQEAAELINSLAMEQLRDPGVGWNTFGLQELEDDREYHEWYDEEGENVNALADALWEKEA